VGYGEAWEQELLERIGHWYEVRVDREEVERALAPDERLDEVGWEIFRACTARGMRPEEAAHQAMADRYAKRCRIRDDVQGGEIRELVHRLDQLRPVPSRDTPFDTQAPDQLAFWSRHLPGTRFVYFIQAGDTGPVKIGLANEPETRTRTLQTGNHRELHLRHVIPGDEGIERQLHDRFREARIRGEWFGGAAYLAMILIFAGGLADEMVHTYDGSGYAPRLDHGQIRTASEIELMRRDIERVYNRVSTVTDIARFLRLDVSEVEDQLQFMTKSTLYDVKWSGYDLLAPYR
jgi:Meiotically up-regulated gene 113